VSAQVVFIALSAEAFLEIVRGWLATLTERAREFTVMERQTRFVDASYSANLPEKKSGHEFKWMTGDNLTDGPGWYEFWEEPAADTELTRSLRSAIVLLSSVCATTAEECARIVAESQLSTDKNNKTNAPAMRVQVFDVRQLRETLNVLGVGDFL
jgi:hypothetical protein